MLNITEAVQSAATITPAAMKTGSLAHATSISRPEMGLTELKDLEHMPTSIDEAAILEEETRLGEMTRAKELVQTLVGLRKQTREQQVGIYKQGIKDKRNSIEAAAKLTKENGEFARFLQGHLLGDRREEAFTSGYQRHRSESVSIY